MTPSMSGVQACFERAAVASPVMAYRRAEVIFAQGDPSDRVLYVLTGGVKLAVISKSGRQGVIAILGPGEFFGEGCLAGQQSRPNTATATSKCTVLSVERGQMERLLREQPALADQFIAHVLARNIRIEEDLVDQLLNPSEKRLARTLLMLSNYHTPDKRNRVVEDISQETLAEMVGTTRPRVNFFMKKFERLGFINYSNGLQVNGLRLTGVLQD